METLGEQDGGIDRDAASNDRGGVGGGALSRDVIADRNTLHHNTYQSRRYGRMHEHEASLRHGTCYADPAES